MALHVCAMVTAYSITPNPLLHLPPFLTSSATLARWVTGQGCSTFLGFWLIELRAHPSRLRAVLSTPNPLGSVHLYFLFWLCLGHGDSVSSPWSSSSVPESWGLCSAMRDPQLFHCPHSGPF